MTLLEILAAYFALRWLRDEYCAINGAAKAHRATRTARAWAEGNR